ncbi:unnamed protein product, partial [Rotaria sp. Silwood2]
DRQLIGPPSLRFSYNCKSKKGLLIIQWGPKTNEVDLAYMEFNVLSTKEDDYQWILSHVASFLATAPQLRAEPILRRSYA